MAEELFNGLNFHSEGNIKEQVNNLADVMEKIMIILLKIPEMVDGSIQILSQNINNIQTQVNQIDSKVSQLETKVASGISVAPGAASGPGTPPPPPGASNRPGSPPPPPGPGRAPAPAAPANPMSLRGSIMDELKSLFSKRRTDDDDED
ncbi:MAG: hypothetical protein ACTSWL_02500 [Promethearchaeota archaeon]